MDIQQIVDAVFNTVKLIEDLDPYAVILPGFTRLIQLDRCTCGVHSLRVILRYYGKRVTLEKLKRQLKTDRDGTGEDDIKRVLGMYRLKYHVEPRGSLGSVRRAIDTGYPVLVSTVQEDHWSVVYGYSDRAVYESDSNPLKNWRRRVSVRGFQRQWGGMMSFHD